MLAEDLFIEEEVWYSLLMIIIMEVLRKFFQQHFIKIVYFSFLIGFVSCKKNIVEQKKELKQLTLHKLFTESTYSDSTKVFTNDSIFCIYKNKDNFTVWRDGILSKTDNRDIQQMIGENKMSKIFHVYKYQSEFMGLDFKKYNDNTKDRSTKDYKILKDGKQYFLHSDGYAKIRLPVSQGNDMDWITFNSMDINDDKIPELFIFHEYFNSKENQEYGETYIYEVKR